MIGEDPSHLTIILILTSLQQREALTPEIIAAFRVSREQSMSM